MSTDSVRFRMTALGIVVLCLFGALFVRLWYLQVLNSSQFQVAAEHNGVRIVSIPAPRGRILDRNGKVVVDNQLINMVTVDRTVVAKHPDVIAQLAAILDETPRQVQQAVDDVRYSSLAPVPIAKPTADQIVYIKEHADGLPGVDVAPEVERLYPFGSLAAHLLGYVGQVNPQELAAHKADGYQPGDQVGKSGIELAYENVLRGTPGEIKYAVDSHGNIIQKLATQPAVPGHDLRLSIDINIQQIAEDSLLKGLQAAQAQTDHQTGNLYPAPAGSVVVEDPKTGQIIALASYPTYNPADFIGGISQTRYAEYTANGDALLDRATQGLYAPGSTFKLVTATAGLQRGLVTPGTPFYDKGFIKVGGQIFRNDGHAAYGTINLQQAITVSSDSYFYTLGAQFWENGRSLALQDTAHAYGFGQPTGIPTGDESGGRVPDPTTRRNEYYAHPGAYETPNWFTGDNINLAIGQGELVVTPLQLANAYATFANGGTVYQPQVAIEVDDGQAHKLYAIPSKVERTVPLAPGDHQAMLAGFEGVVQSGSGTAHGAFAGWPFSSNPVAGKTGTAQVNGKEPTSVFTCWAPADSPQYGVTVFMEQSGYGASAAAPVAHRILAGIYGMGTPGITYIPDAAVN